MGTAILGPILGLGSKLLMGGGGAQAGAAPAPAPGPFDAIHQAPPGGGAPPVPQQNPLFGGQDGPANPAKAIPSRNPLFQQDEELFGRPASPAAPAMPTRNPTRADDAAQGMFGEEYGQFLDAQAADDAEKGLFNTEQTAAKTAPINSIDKRNNSERYSDAGYTLDSRTAGTVAPKATAAAPAKKVATPVEQAEESAPKLDRGLFEQPEATVPPPAAKPPFRDQFDGEEEDGDETSTGEGLFGEQFGGMLGDLQDKLGDSATNPLFQTGLALMASGYDGSNPYKMMLQGLSAIPGQQIAAQGADLALNSDRRAEDANARAERDQGRQDAATEREEAQIKALMALARKYGLGGEVAEPGSNVARGSAKVIR